MDDAAKARLRQEAVKGERMFALLHDEMVSDVLKERRQGLLEMMEEETDRDKRDRIWQELRGLQIFMVSLNRVIETGNMAVKSLQDEAKREESRQARR